MPVITNIASSGGKHGSPFRCRSRDTKSKEGQTGNRQDNGSYLQGRLYNDRSKGVGQNIMEDDGRVLRADGSRSLNVVSAANR